MLVHLFCDQGDCGDGVEAVDVYYDQLQKGASILGYVPDGWRIAAPNESGYPIMLCPRHAEAGAA